MNNEPITEFQGEYRFLSNFWPAEVEYDGDIYPTVEHAYQAAKTLDRQGRLSIMNAATPGIAKRLGKTLPLRRNWEQMKYSVMLSLVGQKFCSHMDLGDKLLATNKRVLIEGNTWDDTYWGVYRGKGQNMLGKLLMQVREEVRWQENSG